MVSFEVQNAQFSKISVPGFICAIEIRETVLYSLEGSLDSNISKETAKKEQKFLRQMASIMPIFRKSLFLVLFVLLKFGKQLYAA